MRDKCFHSTETFRERTELYVIQQTARCFDSAQFKRKHCAESGLLLLGDGVLRVRSETGVKHTFHFGMRFQKLRDGHPIRFVLLHADGESFDAARDEEAVHRREAGSGGALQEIDTVGVFLTREDGGTASAI